MLLGFWGSFIQRALTRGVGLKHANKQRVIFMRALR